MYVGVTSHEPVVRFEQHKTGYKASRIAKKYGRKLMRREYEHLNPDPCRGSGGVGRGAWQRALRRKGYGVWQH